MSAYKPEKSHGQVQTARLGVSSDRLNSWKEIALYLKRQVRTVQHWEKQEGLPIHRHFHRKQGSIFAFRSEIEAWGQARIAGRGSEHRVDTGVVSRPIRIVITAFGRELTAGPLADLLDEVAQLLETAHVKLLSDEDAKAADFILRWKAILPAEHCTAELFSNESQTVVWSRSFGSDASASALVRSIALLVRSAAIGRIWSDLAHNSAVDRRELSSG